MKNLKCRWVKKRTGFSLMVSKTEIARVYHWSLMGEWIFYVLGMRKGVRESKELTIKAVEDCLNEK